MAETELHKLRRLASNRRCGTCRHEDRLGFNAVCVKYQIFVCSDCKSAHQAFSHRCKSVTMSNWNKTEVDALRHENGGGNAMNQATYFASLAPDDRAWPTKGCHPNDFKEFVRTAYEDRRWFSDTPAAPDAEAPATKSSSAPTSMASNMDLLGSMESFASAPAARPPPAATFAADFGKGIDAFGSDNGGGFMSGSDSASVDSLGGSWSTFSSAASAPTPAASEWAAFSSAPAPPPAAVAADDWMAFSAAPAPSPPATAAPTPAALVPGGFDDFVAAARPPTMRKHVTAPASTACTASALDGLSALSLESMANLGAQVGVKPVVATAPASSPQPTAAPSLAAAKSGMGTSPPSALAACAGNGVGVPAGAIGLPMRPPAACPPMPSMGMGMGGGMPGPNMGQGQHPGAGGWGGF
mmetsp:Transcript_15585/g.43667  ORF Transcript_15585/g.43667 Transcript_15585/m.43667 type:complete len:412 (-) Transcript_15585:420-1655(-)